MDHAAGGDQKVGSEFELIGDLNLDFWMTMAGDDLIVLVIKGGNQITLVCLKPRLSVTADVKISEKCTTSIK